MDDIHLNELIIAFNQIQPLLENAFIDVEQTRNCGELAAAELSALKNEFHRIESQITNLQLSLNSQMKKRTNNNKHTPGNMNEDCNSLMLKYVCTPPIKFETINAGRMDNIRLPLFADMQTKTASDPFCANISGTSPLAFFPCLLFNKPILIFLVLPRSARKVTVKDSSIDMNNTNNKSRIIDSTQLLRTIHKSAARAQRKNSQNLSTTSAALLSTSWRERQNLFHFDMESEPVVSTENTIKTISNVGDANKSINRTADNNQMNGLSHISTSPYTPFNSNERTRIPRTHLLDAINSSSGSGGSKTKVFYSRRLSAVQKVQGDSLNIANMSTSPSGRLDALVPTTNEYVDTPRLKLNDITMQENAIFIDVSQSI